MTKSQIVAEIATKNGLTKTAAAEVLEFIAQLAYKNAKDTFTVRTGVIGLPQFSTAAHSLGLGLACALISRGDPTGGLLPMFFFPANNILLGVGFVLALGLVAGALPALQAMRLQIAEALRRV